MSQICPEGPVLLCGDRDPASERPRLPRRAPARAGLVREVPAARRAPGPEEDRAGLDRARPAAGRLLHEADRPRSGCVTCSTRRGAERCPGWSPSGATFADAAAEWLRFIEQDRERKPSTLRDYRSALERAPAAGVRRIAARGRSPPSDRALARLAGGLSNRSKNKLLIELHGIFRRARTVYGLAVNPLLRVEKHPQPRAETSRSSRPRRSGRSCAPPRPSRTARSS